MKEESIYKIALKGEMELYILLVFDIKRKISKYVIIEK